MMMPQFERDLIREQERLARAHMSLRAQAEREVKAAGVLLFDAPVKVTPSHTDPQTQQIQRKLGDYALMRHLLDEQKRYFGLDGIPHGPRSTSGRTPPARLKPDNVFKIPDCTSRAPSHGQKSLIGCSSTDGNLPHGGPNHNRNSYRSDNLQTKNSLLPSLADNHQAGHSIQPLKTPIDSSCGDVEYILKQMTSMSANPLTAIGDTPKKKLVSKLASNTKNDTFAQPKPPMKSSPKRWNLSSYNNRKRCRDLGLTESHPCDSKTDVGSELAEAKCTKMVSSIQSPLDIDKDNIQYPRTSTTTTTLCTIRSPINKSTMNIIDGDASNDIYKHLSSDTTEFSRNLSFASGAEQNYAHLSFNDLMTDDSGTRNKHAQNVIRNSNCKGSPMVCKTIFSSETEEPSLNSKTHTQYLKNNPNHLTYYDTELSITKSSHNENMSPCSSVHSYTKCNNDTPIAGSKIHSSPWRSQNLEKDAITIPRIKDNIHTIVTALQHKSPELSDKLNKLSPTIKYCQSKARIDEISKPSNFVVEDHRNINKIPEHHGLPMMNSPKVQIPNNNCYERLGSKSQILNCKIEPETLDIQDENKSESLNRDFNIANTSEVPAIMKINNEFKSRSSSDSYLKSAVSPLDLLSPVPDHCDAPLNEKSSKYFDMSGLETDTEKTHTCPGVISDTMPKILCKIELSRISIPINQLHARAKISQIKQETCITEQAFKIPTDGQESNTGSEQCVPCVSGVHQQDSSMSCQNISININAQNQQHYASNHDRCKTHKVYYSYLERNKQDILGDEGKDQNSYLSEAKRLKHEADLEIDQTAQALKYLEAVLYFLLTCHVMEREAMIEKAAFKMYNETLSLTKFISYKFCNQQNNCVNIHKKLGVLSLRCQSLIYFKLFKMKKYEVKEFQKIVLDYQSKEGSSNPVMNTDHVTTPSYLSPTPSPTQTTRGPTLSMGPCILVPLSIQSGMQKQNLHLNYLVSCHDLWEQGDNMVVEGNHQEFFIDLDHQCGPLTLHSTLHDLVRYVRAGIQRLRDLCRVQP